MKVLNYNRTESHVVTFTLQLAGEEWKAYLDTASRQLQRQRPANGFRAGKMPLNAALAQYGKALYDLAAQTALNGALPQACQEVQADPVSQPVFGGVTADADQLQAGVTFLAYPEIESLACEGVTIVRPFKRASEATVDAAIEKYRQQNLYVHPVERPVQPDDIVEVHFSGTHEGQGFPHDQGDSRFRIGSGQLFAGLDEALVGHSAGETLALQLTMPADFHREEIRGFTLDLQVRLKGVWARDLEDCTDEFVQRNEKDCRTVAELREKLKKKIEHRYAVECERRFEQNTDTAIAGLITCQLPEPMVQVAIQGILDSVAALAAQSGMTLEQLLQSEGRTLEQYVAQCRPIAEQKVRRSIALDYVMRAQQFEVTEQDYTRHLLAGAGGIADVAKAEEALGGREQVMMDILNDRARQWILDHAEIVEQEIPEERKL